MVGLVGLVSGSWGWRGLVGGDLGEVGLRASRQRGQLVVPNVPLGLCWVSSSMPQKVVMRQRMG